MISPHVTAACLLRVRVCDTSRLDPHDGAHSQGRRRTLDRLKQPRTDLRGGNTDFVQTQTPQNDSRPSCACWQSSSVASKPRQHQQRENRCHNRRAGRRKVSPTPLRCNDTRQRRYLVIARCSPLAKSLESKLVPTTLRLSWSSMSRLSNVSTRPLRHTPAALTSISTVMFRR